MSNEQALRALIGEYWDIAYREGAAGLTHDTPNGDAQRVWSQIEAALTTHARPVDEAIRQAVFNWLDTLESGAQDRGAVQAGLVRDICRIAAPHAQDTAPRGGGEAEAFVAGYCLGAEEWQGNPTKPARRAAETMARHAYGHHVRTAPPAAQASDTGRGEAKPLAWLVMYGQRVIGWTTEQDRELVRLAQGERLVPVAEVTHKPMQASEGADSAPSFREYAADAEAERFCDGHCTWLEHHPNCARATQEPSR